MRGEARRYSKLPREELDKIDYKNVAPAPALRHRARQDPLAPGDRPVAARSVEMARAVKRARELGLLPYVDATRPLERTGGRGRSRDATQQAENRSH